MYQVITIMIIGYSVQFAHYRNETYIKYRKK